MGINAEYMGSILSAQACLGLVQNHLYLCWTVSLGSIFKQNFIVYLQLKKQKRQTRVVDNNFAFSQTKEEATKEKTCFA